MPQSEIDRLHAFVDRSNRLFILTGAGCSTESGIPDYRSPNGEWRRHKPVLYERFRRSEAIRQRYWARNFVGWPRMQHAAPNGAHHALATIESIGLCSGVTTQNVDGLHQAAGSRTVVELHGTTAKVICLDCRNRISRLDLQAVMEEQNPGWEAGSIRFAPDADASIDEDRIASFVVPECPYCGGVLKPDVVFFGENVDREIVASCFSRVESADAMLVVGSSLSVWSGYRFVRAAAEREIPIAIVNIGVTRGDAHASLKVEQRCGVVLPQLVERLVGSAGLGCRERPASEKRHPDGTGRQAP